MCLQQTDIHINLVTFTPSALAKLEHNTDRKAKPTWQKAKSLEGGKLIPPAPFASGPVSATINGVLTILS